MVSTFVNAPDRLHKTAAARMHNRPRVGDGFDMNDPVVSRNRSANIAGWMLACGFARLDFPYRWARCAKPQALYTSYGCATNRNEIVNICVSTTAPGQFAMFTPRR